MTWHAFKVSDGNYGIFETEDNRQTHLNGRIPAALAQVATDRLAADPDIRLVDIAAT